MQNHHNNEKKQIIEFDYKIGEVVLERVIEVRDLGVLVDSKLNFSGHIDRILSSTTKSLGFLVRSCRKFHNIKTLKIQYYIMLS